MCGVGVPEERRETNCHRPGLGVHPPGSPPPPYTHTILEGPGGWVSFVDRRSRDRSVSSGLLRVLKSRSWTVLQDPRSPRHPFLPVSRVHRVPSSDPSHTVSTGHRHDPFFPGIPKCHPFPPASVLVGPGPTSCLHVRPPRTDFDSRDEDRKYLGRP